MAASCSASFSVSRPTRAANGNWGGVMSAPARARRALRRSSRLQPNVSQGLHRLRGGVLPQPAIGGFEQPLRNRVQRPRIGLLEELLHLRRQRVLGGQPFVDEVGRDVRRRVEAEDVVHRRRQLQPALVAVTADAVEPLGIDDARPVDAQRLFAQVAHRRRRAASCRRSTSSADGRSAIARSRSCRRGTGSSRRSRRCRARGCPGCARRPRSSAAARRTRRARRRRRPRGRRRSRPTRRRRSRNPGRSASVSCRSAAECRRRRCPASRRRCDSGRAPRPRPAPHPRAAPAPRGSACAGSSAPTGSSSETTSSTARSTSAIRCGNASRKKPLMRSVTSMRGRPSRSSGTTARS